VQVQAILDGTESIAEEIVELAGFSMLAELQQMVLMLPANPDNLTIESAKLPDGLVWVDARSVSHARLTQLIAHTFIETLDCPGLNGLRSPEDVLEGFLDGQTLASQQHWWLLASGDKLLGCSLVNPLSHHKAELVYMGLGVTSRGRGYGKLLLEQAIRSSLQMRAESFFAAVDCDNWPAIRLYAQAGLYEHARVQAWIHKP
jgi:ribosomal protein S18 acetylase RimI-like enzyme